MKKDYDNAVELFSEMLSKCPDYSYSIKPLLVYGNDTVNAQKLREKALKKKNK